MATEAQNRATKKYTEKTYDVLAVLLPLEMNDTFLSAVSKSGEGKGEYVRNALVRKLTKDGFLPPEEE